MFGRFGGIAKRNAATANTQFCKRGSVMLLRMTDSAITLPAAKLFERHTPHHARECILFRFKFQVWSGV
jgi:hypothetical protein